MTKEKKCATFVRKKGNGVDMNKIVKKFRQLFRNGGHKWKSVAAGGLMAVGIIGICIVCGQTYRRSRAEAELEKLSENTDKVWTPVAAVTVLGASGATLLPGENIPAEAAGRDMRTVVNMEIPIPEKDIDFSYLQNNVNKDIYAWIDIPDTRIDYPILQHPVDNTYYLNYNMDGSEGYPGCIYTEDCNAKDFADPNTVVYGHNMKDGSMFAGLHQFADREYFETHPYIYIYTEDKLYVYEVFAAYECGDEHILYSCDFTDDAAFEKYLEKIYDLEEDADSSVNIREELDVTAGDHLLTLSTCVTQRPERRYLVQGVLLNGE